MVSIIIPIYNRAHYIKDCLDSVLNQTYKDYEIIVVDDGSSDNLKKVLIPYMDKINYIYKENGGAASARNLGIQHAKGDYIAWLDSDDIWFDFKLKLQMEILSKVTDVGYIHSDFSCFSDNRDRIANSYIRGYCHTLRAYKLTFSKMFSNKRTLKDLNINTIDDGVNVYWGDVSDKVILGSTSLTSTTIVKRGCIERVGFFNEKYRTAEDYDFHARLAKKYKVAYVDISTMKYRRFNLDKLSGAHMELESNLNWLNIAIELGMNDKDFYIKHKNLVDLRISHCYCGVGSLYIRRKQFEKALNYLLKSLRVNFRQRRLYLYILMALFYLTKNKLFNYLFNSNGNNK